MTFRYRFVGFGTSFQAAHGVREAASGFFEPGLLYENEIAVDVGGVCLGCDVTRLNVIDHHFFRPGSASIPCSSSAVIQHADLLQKRFFGTNFSVIWLVAHHDADFDSFASMYLVRWIFEELAAGVNWRAMGIAPSGGHPAVAEPDVNQQRRGFDWLAPHRSIARFDAEANREFVTTRWAILLASYAARVDQSRRISTARNRALHSVLYAAILRGRPYNSAESGAMELFVEARRHIESGLDPSFDVVLDRNGLFAPEFALLDLELDAYKRDLRRSRKAIVFVPSPPQPFEKAYALVRCQPLLDEQGEIRDAHLEHMSGPNRRAFDGIYLRDPECLLFKEWARLDVDASSMHQGFTFTFVAYSSERSDGLANTSNYFIAINPERAGSCHLYTVWAKLQKAEVAELRSRAPHAKVPVPAAAARNGFHERAGEHVHWFSDPWYDAANYGCTLVATPNHGTVLAPAGTSSDFSDDDPVAEIVRTELESWIYADGMIAYRDVSAKADHQDKPTCQQDVRRLVTLPVPTNNYFRFVKTRLHDVVDLSCAPLVRQISELLWYTLHPGARVSFETLHARTFQHGDLLGVWSGAGIAIAFTSRAADTTANLGQLFESLAKCARDIDELVKFPEVAALKSASGNQGDSEVVDMNPQVETRALKGEQVMRHLVDTRHKLTLPEGRLLTDFVRDTGIGELAATLRDLNTAQKLDVQTKQMAAQMKTVADVQTKLERVELLFAAAYAIEVGHIFAENAFAEQWRLAATIAIAAPFTLFAARLMGQRLQERANRRIAGWFVIIVLLGLAAGVAIGHYRPPDGLKQLIHAPKSDRSWREVPSQQTVA